MEVLFAKVKLIIVEGLDIFVTTETRGILSVYGELVVLVTPSMVSATEEGTLTPAVVLVTTMALVSLCFLAFFEFVFQLGNFLSVEIIFTQFIIV